MKIQILVETGHRAVRCWHALATASGLSSCPTSLCLSPAAVLFLLVAWSASAQSLSPTDVKNLLARIQEKRGAMPQMQADFQEEKFIRLMNKPLTTAGTVWFSAPNKFRREVRGNSPSVTVSDGQELWIYYPSFKSAEHYLLGQRSPLDATIAALLAGLNLQNVESSYSITATKISNGYELELVPRRQSLKKFFERLRVQIEEDSRARRTEMLQPNGDRIVTKYSNYGTGSIPSSMFEFRPPPGTQVTTPLGR